MKRLYYIQDADRPMHVVADGFDAAIEKWAAQMRLEAEEGGGENPDLHVDPPDGVQLLCSNDSDFPELLL